MMDKKTINANISTEEGLLEPDTHNIVPVNNRIRKKFIDIEIPYICKFLAGFSFNDASIRPEIELDDNYDWMRILNFPLPDYGG